MAYRVLEVNLLSAKDLKNVNLITRMEVYAVATISGDPLTRQCTPPDPYGGRHPSWNATLRFTVPPTASAASGCLHVLLRAERSLGDRDVGEVIVPLAEILASAGAGDPGPRPPQYASYQVRKVHRTETRGVLHLTYRLGPVVAPQVPQEKPKDPVVAYPGIPVAEPLHPPAFVHVSIDSIPRPPQDAWHVAVPPSPQASGRVAKSPRPQATGHVAVPPSPQASGRVAKSPPPQAAGHVVVPPSPQASGRVAKSPPPQAAGHVAVPPSPQPSGRVAMSPPPQAAGHVAVPPSPQASGRVAKLPPAQAAGHVVVPPSPQTAGHLVASPPPKAAGHVAVSPRTAKNNGKLDFGMGFGAGLAGGAIGGMLAGDMAYNTGYRHGLADGGGAEF